MIFFVFDDVFGVFGGCGEYGSRKARARAEGGDLDGYY
jgi:hypothetical protein